ncbi:hypothetical protein C8J57DRAFT_1436235 [Mycena rebaudengoi]|nr:hypothetical protein C8J57DRAFT_1436235 [Mycena rebaudengoi]
MTDIHQPSDIPAPPRQSSPFDAPDDLAGSGSTNGNDNRTDQERETDRKLAERLSSIIEDANNKCTPLCKMIRKHIENMEARKEEDRDEAELVKNVKPLLEQAEKILNETNGAVRGADPDNRLSNKAQRNMQDHKASPEEQRLAEALKTMVQEVGGTLEWAKDKLDSYPKAKKDLGPLFEAVSRAGLGLDSLLKGIVAATGLDKIYKGLGLGKWLNMK